jgi:hypothetical protein
MWTSGVHEKQQQVQLHKNIKQRIFCCLLYRFLAENFWMQESQPKKNQSFALD